MRSRTAAPATYSRTDHIAMVALATVGCLLLLAPQRDPVFTHGVPRPPGRSTTLNCRILNSTLKLSSCDGYAGGYVYPLLITGVGRSGTRFAAKQLTALGYDVAHSALNQIVTALHAIDATPPDSLVNLCTGGAR